MARKYTILERISNKNKDVTYKDLQSVYTTYFQTIRDVFKFGTHPGVVLTGLLSFQFSASSTRVKAKNLGAIIESENFSALKKRFKITNIDEAAEKHTELLRIFEMKTEFDNQNTLAKRRNNNGWKWKTNKERALEQRAKQEEPKE